jgi:arginine utilization regulatory protein
LESTLFGTSKGAFTGAVDRPGLFEQAHKGTLFLDEIDSMDVGLQAKLLRVLQESYVRRVGATKDKKVDVRVIAATNRDPSDLLNEGLIRKDLFYRLNVITLKLPRLCSRKKDIEILVKHFIKQYNNSLSKSVIRVQDEVMKIFKSYDWKGNVRELSNCVESIMAIMDDDSVIRLEHVPTYMMDVMTDSEVDIIDYKCGDDEDLNDILSRIEIDIIRKQLSQSGGNVSKTASKLGISRQNLQYKIKKYGL